MEIFHRPGADCEGLKFAPLVVAASYGKSWGSIDRVLPFTRRFRGPGLSLIPY